MIQMLDAEKIADQTWRPATPKALSPLLEAYARARAGGLRDRDTDLSLKLGSWLRVCRVLRHKNEADPPVLRWAREALLEKCDAYRVSLIDQALRRFEIAINVGEIEQLALEAWRKDLDDKPKVDIQIQDGRDA